MYGNSFPIRTSFICQIIFTDKHGFISLSSWLCGQRYAAFRPVATLVSRGGRGVPAGLTLWVTIAGMGARTDPSPAWELPSPQRKENGTYAKDMGAAGPWGARGAKAGQQPHPAVVQTEGLPRFLSCSF